VISKETIIWAAEQRYPYIALNTSIEQTKKIWELYDETAARVGYKSGPENRGYLARIHVAETEEKALKNAREFTWMQGEFTGLAHPVWANPAGYFSPGGRRGFVEFAVGRAINPRGNMSFEEQLQSGMIMAGTPKQVLPRVRELLEETRPGILAVWAQDGKVSHEDSKTCIRLLGQEVFPQIREWAKEFDLKSPFEVDAPVSIKYAKDLRKPAVAAE
jgi:alkanesulfonate monooxygenase SsuD/methylene tetrahydromethanopterin reductase-like flavin-dependent oxidoreductase (luciferase family)